MIGLDKRMQTASLVPGVGAVARVSLAWPSKAVCPSNAEQTAPENEKGFQEENKLIARNVRKQITLDGLLAIWAVRRRYSLPTVTEHINMLGHEKPKHNTARKSELDNKTRSGAASALEYHSLNTCLSG